jgi:hypothetical protein
LRRKGGRVWVVYVVLKMIARRTRVELEINVCTEEVVLVSNGPCSSSWFCGPWYDLGRGPSTWVGRDCGWLLCRGRVDRPWWGGG